MRLFNIFNRSQKPEKPRPMAEVDAALGLEKPAKVNPKFTSGPISKPAQPALPEFDRTAFFAALREGKLRHKRTSQVKGSEAIIDAMQRAPLSWAAYALATAWLETGATMQPIKEWGGNAYFMRMYDKTGARPHVARALGNTEVGDGATFAGRGYVQLTGRANYTKAQRKLDVPLVSDPDLAMRPDIAARIMREGMTDAWFTGRGFVHFLPSSGPASLEQFRQSRRIINGLDKATKIAQDALEFQSALIAGGWREAD